jgi:hypothetical protein
MGFEKDYLLPEGGTEFANTRRAVGGVLGLLLYMTVCYSSFGRFANALNSC